MSETSRIVGSSVSASMSQVLQTHTCSVLFVHQVLLGFFVGLFYYSFSSMNKQVPSKDIRISPIYVITIAAKL